MISMLEIKKEIKKQGYTQESFAEKLGVSRTSVQQWFRGTSKPTMARYEQILEILNLDQASNQSVSAGHIINAVSSNVTAGDNSPIHGANDTAATKAKFIEVPVIDNLKTMHSNSSIAIRNDNIAKDTFAMQIYGTKELVWSFANNQLPPEYSRFNVYQDEIVVITPYSMDNMNDTKLIGRLVVATSDDKTETLVKMLHRDTKHQLWLMPLNPEYQNEFNIKKADDYKIIGYVCKVVSDRSF